MFRWWPRRRPDETPVKLAEPLPKVDPLAELVRILEEAGEPVAEPASMKEPPIPLRPRSARKPGAFVHPKVRNPVGYAS